MGAEVDFEGLYRTMARAREFELATAELWQKGLISGELHVGTGEEAVAAGVVGQLGEDDALALTHRSSPFVVARGVPLVPLIRELLGREGGLGGGRGGHMHLFSREHLVATSGIVGASLPQAAGFALAAKRLRPRSIAVAQTGDGAMNQGMALETLNLAVVWKLPLLVVCIDNGWAITTRAGAVTAGDLSERARAFGFAAENVDGTDAAEVSRAAKELIQRVRRGKGPAFLYATCPRMSGHQLGDPLLRIAREPLGEGRDTMKSVMGAAVASGGGSVLSRAAGLAKMMGTMHKARGVAQMGSRGDPLLIARKRLRSGGCDHEPLDAQARDEVRGAVAAAMEGHDA